MGRMRGEVKEIIFRQNHWKFRFVTLPQETPDKMKLHHRSFHKLCYFPCKFQGLYSRLVEILHDFFITPVNSVSWPLEFQHFNFSIPLRNTLPPSCMFFFLKQAIHEVTLTLPYHLSIGVCIFPVSDEWLIFCCRNLILR